VRVTDQRYGAAKIGEAAGLSGGVSVVASRHPVQSDVRREPLFFCSRHDMTMYIWPYIYVNIYIHIYIYIYIHMYMCVYIMYVCVCVCVCV